MSKMTNLNQAMDEIIESVNKLKELLSSMENEEVKTYTFQEVRGIMASLASSGKKTEAKSLLTKYGATRLSEVNEDDYPALVADAEVLANG